MTTKSARLLGVALLTAFFLTSTAPNAVAQLSCAALASGSGLGGGAIGAQLGARLGIAGLGTAIPGTIPVGITGALMFAAGALIACSMPYWGPAATISVLELLTAIGATALVTAIIAYLTDLPKITQNAWRTVRRRFIELTTDPIMAFDSIWPHRPTEWPAPSVRLTATATTLFAPPYSDPDELLDFIREQLRR